MLATCASNAVAKKDDAGNRKLSKSRSRGRIHGLVSLAMAIVAAGEHIEQKPIVSVYELIAQAKKAEAPAVAETDDVILAAGPRHLQWQAAKNRYEARLDAADDGW